MKYKMFFLFFLLFFLLYVYIDHLNPDVVKLYFGYGKYYETSVPTYAVASFIMGVIFSMIISFFADIKKMITGWRQDKKEKRRKEFLDVFDKAKSYDLRGDREKAIENLNRLIRRYPDIEDTYIFLSDLYASMKEYDKAMETLELAEVNLGGRETILLKRAKIRLAAKDLQKAENDLKGVLKINELNLEAMALLRDYYISGRHWDEAYDIEKKLRKIIKTEDEGRKILGIRW